MQDGEIIQWINTAFTTMPIGKEVFFKELWQKGKLKYDTAVNGIDIIDRLNASLVCTSLDSKQPTLVVLPDDLPHRGPAMFSTALLRSSVKYIELAEANHKVIYFGTSLGFKYSFTKTSIKNILLNQVFSYTQISGFGKQLSKKSEVSSTNLPEVICVYQPIHPEEFIQIYDPDWIAVDCSKENEITWLADLVAYCKKTNKPIIGWCQNNFSSATKTFKDFNGTVFFDPKRAKEKTTSSIGDLFINSDRCFIQPHVFDNTIISSADKLVLQAKTLLKQISERHIGQLMEDSLRTAWIYLRTLERLTVPVATYNNESRFFKYVYSFDSLEFTLKRYIELISKSDGIFSGNLSKFLTLIKEVQTKFHDSNPPYWSVLSDYCTDRSPEGMLRVIVFPKRHQKQLFAYTLLSQFNINEDELLTDSRIILKTLKEFSNPGQADLHLYQQFNIAPIIAGLPDFYNRSLFYELLNKWHLDVIIYPHQLSALNSIIQDFNRMEESQMVQSIECLRELTKHPNSPATSSNRVARYALSDQVTIIKVDEEKVKKSKHLDSSRLLAINDFQTEISKLLESGEKDEEDIEYLINLNIGVSTNGSSSHDSILIENVLEIKLQDNYHFVVDPDEEVNIVTDRKIDKIFVRALKPGDKIVLIENQSRQTLYDLIISRVHSHPSLEIHLAILKRWRTDFHIGFTKWREENRGKGLDEFLILLQGKGSKIKSALTVSNWVNGYVMRPQDEQDIQRIGEIIGLKFLTENHSKISKAAARIAGLHIGLSRKLNSWIESNATNGNQRDDLELIDKELGLTFGELRSSIKILKVVSTTEVHKPTLQSHLGRLEKITP